MTNEFHDQIAPSAEANAATFNAPLGQLDAAIKSFKEGAPFTKLNIGTDTTLIIASDAITVTKARHLIDTEGSASIDQLANINGMVEGQILFLELANASRVVEIVTSGNIRPISDATTRMDNTNRVMMLYSDGTLVREVGFGAPLRGSAYNNFLIGASQLALQPAPQARNSFRVKAAAATVDAMGLAAPTVSGTPSVSNDTDSTYVNLLSGAVIGNIAGYISTTFNLVRRQHNPIFHIIFRTGAAADIANIRFWIGLFSAAPTNADALGATQGIAFRYSTVAPDARFVGVTSDGTTQQVTAAIGGAIAASTRYLLSFEVSAAGVVTFRVNNSQSAQISANLPAAATELGFAAYLITTAAVAKNWKLSRLYCEYD